jgi:hypothetical protein
MKRAATSIVLATLLVLPSAASAQTKTKPADQPGHSESAPGQRAEKPGEAKNYAPGQMKKKKDDPRSPGASEYAPGQKSDAKKPAKGK